MNYLPEDLYCILCGSELMNIGSSDNVEYYACSCSENVISIETTAEGIIIAELVID